MKVIIISYFAHANEVRKANYHTYIRISYFTTFTLTTFCISIVFTFSWEDCKSLEKLKTMLMQNLLGRGGGVGRGW